MARRLKTPLNSDAVAIANDEFYLRYPELCPDGEPIALDPDNPEHEIYLEEWVDLYLANGGELAPDSAPRSAGESRYLDNEKYTPFEKKEIKDNPIDVPDDSHVFFSRATRLMVDHRWALSGYYVYMDVDPTDKVDFDTLGLLWTDENGYPHYLENDQKVIGPVEFTVSAWSNKTNGITGKITDSIAIIYGRDIEDLKTKKGHVEQVAAGGKLPERYRCGALQDGFNGEPPYFLVPEDKDVFDMDELLQVMSKCDSAISEAQKIKNEMFRFITKSVCNQTLVFHRDTINGWLDQISYRKDHLVKHGNTDQSLYQLTCETLDKVLAKLQVKYEACLNRLETILSDEATLENIGKIDYWLGSEYNPTGEYELWRHQFMCEALGAFSGTKWEHSIYKKYVAPLIHNLSTPFDDFRNKCKCSSCGFFEDQATTLPHKIDLKGESFWKSKDLKLGTRTGLRLIDLFVKFKDNIGFFSARLKPTSNELEYVIGLNLRFFIRSSIYHPEAGSFINSNKNWMEKVAKIWIQRDQTVSAEKMSTHLADIEKQLSKGNKWKSSYSQKIADALTLVGAASALWYIFSKEGQFTTKDAAEYFGAVSDIGKASTSLGKAVNKEKIFALFGKPQGENLIANLSRYGRIFGLSASGFQVCSSYISLTEAVERGDGRESIWSGISFFGAEVSFFGVLLDFNPDPTASKAVGLILNFIGGVIYLAGAAGEFLTRPEDIELFLRNEYFWTDDVPYYASPESPYAPNPGGVKRGVL